MSSILLQQDNYDTIFKEELKNAFNSVYKLLNLNMSEDKRNFEFKLLADSFYEKFKNSPIPVRSPTPDLDYVPQLYSTAVIMPNGCFLVPFFIYQTYVETPTITFDSEFSQDVTWLELIGLINQKRLNQRFKLTRTTVLVCKVLSRYGIKGQQFKFPLTAEIIGNRTRQSLSIVRSTFTSVYLRLLARDFFLLNPWKLGWELYMLVYPQEEDESISKLDYQSIAIEICSNRKMFRVVQLPMVKEPRMLDELYNEMRKVNGQVYPIYKTNFSWDLSQLEPRQDKSFTNPPSFGNIFSEARESDIAFEYDSNSLQWLAPEIINGDKKLARKFHPDDKNTVDDQSFSMTELKKQRILDILNYLIEFGIPLINYDLTAEKIGIPVDEFSTLLRFLIKNRVIALAHRFKYIGAGREYCFLIENVSNGLKETIRQFLLRFVFSYFYIGDTFIAGRVQVPDNWVANFIEYFTRLQFRHKNLQISYGQRLMGYHYFMPNIKLPHNYILSEFGMKRTE